MSESPNQLILKVFSGPHVGAEVVLADGEYVIGQSDDADIILNDPEIAGTHARLIVKNDQTTCVAIGDAEVFVDGNSVTDVDLQHFQYFTLGSTHLAVGPMNASWPNRPLPEATSPEEDGSESVVERSVHGNEESVDEVNESREEPVSQTDETAETSAHRKPNYWGTVAAVLILLPVLGGFSAAVLAGYLGDGSSSQLQRATLGELRGIVHQYAPESSVEITESDGLYTAEGYVKTEDVERSLEEALWKADPAIDTHRIWSTESAVRAARRTLQSYQLPLNVAIGDKPGQIVVTGNVTNVDTWHHVRDVLKSDTRFDELVDHVNKASQPVSPTETVKTSVTKPVEKEVKTTEEKPAEQPAKPAKTTTVETPPFQVAGVTIGLSRFATLDNGANVYVGSRVAGGYRVNSIDREAVVMTKDGVTHTFHVGSH